MSQPPLATARPTSQGAPGLLPPCSGDGSRRSARTASAIRPAVAVPNGNGEGWLAEQALPHACRLASTTGASLVLVRAAPHVPVAGDPASPLRVTVREAEAYLSVLRQRLAGEGFAVSTVALHDTALHAITHAARTSGAEIIVMSTHGRTGVGRALLGSVADEVLRHTTLPVLLVHAPAAPAAHGRGPYGRILVPLDGTALGETALVEYVEHDGALHAVTIIDGRVRLHALGNAGPLRHSLVHLPFALHRLAQRRTPAAQRLAATQVLDHVTATLDCALLTPLARHVGDRPLLLVPAGWLQSLPWSALPSCAGRSLSVTPSAALWYRAQGRIPQPSGAVSVVAGPGLPGALQEATTVAALHPNAQILHGPAATAQAVAAAMDGAHLVHIAAHAGHGHHPLFVAAVPDGHEY